MAKDQWHRRGTASFLADEVNVDSIDWRLEVVEAVELGLMRAPVIFLDPVGTKFLHVVEIGSVRPASIVRHLMPGIVGDTLANLRQRFVGHREREGFNRRHSKCLKQQPAGGSSRTRAL